MAVLAIRREPAIYIAGFKASMADGSRAYGTAPQLHGVNVLQKFPGLLRKGLRPWALKGKISRTFNYNVACSPGASHNALNSGSTLPPGPVARQGVARLAPGCSLSARRALQLALCAIEGLDADHGAIPCGCPRCRGSASGLEALAAANMTRTLLMRLAEAKCCDLNRYTEPRIVFARLSIRVV